MLHDDSVAFDARTILETAARERVTLMTIVGDAYARPLVEELRRTDYDLSSLASIGTGGAVTSQALKEELLDLVPHLTITDGYGSSETGGMAFGLSRKGEAVRRFAPSSGATVLSGGPHPVPRPRRRGDRLDGARRTHPARLPRRPRRHRADLPRSSTAQRVSVPGDRATLAADGTIAVLGRDSMVVNTGGEKVFVEEVEEAIRLHPDVARCPRRRPAERALRRGGGRARPAPAGRRARAPRRAGLRGAVGGAVQGARARCSCATGSAATPRASPTTGGPRRRPPTRSRRRLTPTARIGHSGSGTSKCASRSSNAFFVPCSARALTKLNSSVLELEVRAVGVEEVAQHLLALVRLQLLDEAERLLRHDDAVGRHPRRLLAPTTPPAPRPSASSSDLGEDARGARASRPRIVSPVRSRRRASTGPSRWKNRWSEPSAGPRKRVAGMPISVSRATTAMSAISASSKPPPSA